MREKQLRVVIAFPTTTDAMALEAYCAEHSVPGRIIPLPPIISAGCGLCWSAPREAEPQVLSAVEDSAVRTAGVYDMML